MATLSLPAEPINAATSLSFVEASSSSSSSSSSSKSGDGVQSKGKQKERHRIIAACGGAVVTSLTMTPFDVVKTRMQTQSSSESLFIPSSHVPPPTTAVSSSQGSTNQQGRWKGKGRALQPSPVTGPMQHARSLAATNLATCCQKTYFTNNLVDGRDILCSFDPREAASGSSSTTMTTARSFSSAARNIAVPFLSSTSFNSNGGHLTLALDSSTQCLYPSPAVAAEHLPQLSAPSARRFTGFFDAFLKIGRHEGITALWRGVSATLVMSVPSQVMYMVGYDTLRSSALQKAPAQYRKPLDGQPTSAYITTTTFVAGSFSRTVVAVMLAPLELVRTRIQSTQANVSLPSILGSVRTLMKEQGTRSLWRGLSATLWRDVPFSGAYWAGYEGIRRFLTNGKGMGESVEGDLAGKTFGISFASGAGSGMIASFLTHPFDVIKTRRQTESSSAKARSTLAFARDIIRKEGMAGLWSGLVPRIAKVAPACGIMIGAYEALR